MKIQNLHWLVSSGQWAVGLRLYINFDEEGSNLDGFEQQLIFKIWLKSISTPTCRQPNPYHALSLRQGQIKATARNRLAFYSFSQPHLLLPVCR